MSNENKYYICKKIDEPKRYVGLTLDEFIPIIAITAYAMAGDEVRITEAGCDYYITKPINKKLLFEKISEYTDK